MKCYLLVQLAGSWLACGFSQYKLHLIFICSAVHFLFFFLEFFLFIHLEQFNIFFYSFNPHLTCITLHLLYWWFNFYFLYEVHFIMGANKNTPHTHTHTPPHTRWYNSVFSFEVNSSQLTLMSQEDDNVSATSRKARCICTLWFYALLAKQHVMYDWYVWLSCFFF